MQEQNNNQSKPLVSVVINTFNRCNILGRAIQSAINQTYQNLEIIIIDANSVDNTREVVDSFTDKRIIYFKSPTSEIAPCLNKGFSLAQGEFVALLDDDDEWLDTKIEKQVELFMKLDETYGWIGCGEEFWDDQAERVQRVYIPYSRGDVHLKLLEGKGGGTAGGSLLMIRKQAIDKMGGFVDKVKFSTDFLFYLRLSSQYKFDFVEEVLSRTHINHIYEHQRGSIIRYNRAFILNKIEVQNYILNEYKRAFDNNPKFRHSYFVNLAKYYSYIRDFKQSLIYMFKAILLKPFELLSNIKFTISILCNLSLRSFLES
jgi:glycosyltransferase involved in cell wall biosynthesis